MTEVEWQEHNYPEGLLRFLETDPKGRKTRLCAVACCRSIWHLLEDGSRHAVEVAERFADGQTTNAERRAAVRMCRGVTSGAEWAQDAASRAVELCPFARQYSLFQLARFGLDSSSYTKWFGRAAVEEHDALRRRNSSTEDSRQVAFLRDIFGNPFRPVAFAPEWRTDTVVALARQMYDAREFGAMPILADALQDAGCEEGQILEHCRGTGPHVRGCWVVDFVLGKE